MNQQQASMGTETREMKNRLEAIQEVEDELSEHDRTFVSTIYDRIWKMGDEADLSTNQENYVGEIERKLRRKGLLPEE